MVLGVILMKGYSTFCEASGLEPLYQMQFSVISRTLVGGGVLHICRSPVTVFYSPSELGWVNLWPKPTKIKQSIIGLIVILIWKFYWHHQLIFVCLGIYYKYTSVSKKFYNILVCDRIYFGVWSKVFKLWRVPVLVGSFCADILHVVSCVIWKLYKWTCNIV